MGNKVSRARYLTLGSFIINFATQNYGMFIKPNMKDIADANHFAFSPNPWFIAAFFSGQAILQLYWIRKLFLLDPASAGYQQLATSPATVTPATAVDANAKIDEQEAIKTAVEYAPIYAFGNLCIAGWLFFWLKESFTISQVLVTINTVAQLYAVVRLPPLTTSSHPLLRATHLVAKTFAGIGILDFVDNGAVALKYTAPPSTLVQVLTYTIFPLTTAISTPIFGSIIVYDLLAIFVGQRFGDGGVGMSKWGANLGLTALISGAIVAFKGIASRSRM